MPCSRSKAFIGDFLLENDSAKVSTVKSSSNGSGLMDGRASVVESTSHNLPNLRLSRKRSSRPSSNGKKWRVIGSAITDLGCTMSLPVIPK